MAGMFIQPKIPKNNNQSKNKKKNQQNSAINYGKAKLIIFFQNSKRWTLGFMSTELYKHRESEKFTNNLISESHSIPSSSSS